MAVIQDFTGCDPTWCPGCGNWAIGMALKQSLQELNYEPSSSCIVFGIGCSGNMNDFINAYAMHSLHGRAIPNAIGIKLANHTMKVMVVAGDGDCYGEGGNHFMHACRGNHDITVIVHNNNVYGLTTGQVAPTAQKGFKSKSTPAGIIENPLNPLAVALYQGATFIAQAFAGDFKGLTDILKKGIQHKGFSLINILQPCVTFNKLNSFKYYLEHSYKLSENNEYDEKSFKNADEKIKELNSFKFPIGVLYNVEMPTYTEQLSTLKECPLISKAKTSDYQLLANDFI